MLTNWFSQPAGSARSSIDDDGRVGEHDDDAEVVEPDEGNDGELTCLVLQVLSHLISQLRPGADLSRVVLPTFILEPRSMLERITKWVVTPGRLPRSPRSGPRLTSDFRSLRSFMCHPEMLLKIPTIDDPTERFVSVVKFYLSGWHIRPPGVKKPLNPILGEVFTCYWDLEHQKRAYYISEQTSHHPPKSSYFYMAPHHHIRIDGTLKPRSRFLGNSAASIMEGIAFLGFLNRGEDPNKGEQYIITQPNMYARGILFGKMKYELGDHSFVRCPELDLTADVDFKTKGWVGGTYNAIGGVIKKESTGEILYELSGLWSDEMFIRDTGHKEMFFDATKSTPSPPRVRPIAEQDERESQRLWEKTARAVKERNHEVATDEKTKIEDRQREAAASRAQDDVEWHPRLFRRVRGGPGGPEEGEEDLEWVINATVDPTATPERQTEQVLAIYPIIDGQKLDERNTIPPRQAAKPPARDAKPSGEGTDNLIDFGDDDAPPARGSLEVPAKQPAKQADDMDDLLSWTGNPAAGPRNGFAEEAKKDLPEPVVEEKSQS
ncbi:hypothetical protein RJ55_01407 [Drechmeria coniospora]|nr:hypothetical protein RJ55_01407 [Drechmeria coniospora]